MAEDRPGTILQQCPVQRHVPLHSLAQPQVSTKVSKFPELLAELEEHVGFIGQMRVHDSVGDEIAEALHPDIMEAAQRSPHLRVQTEKLAIHQRRLQRAKDSSIDLGHHQEVQRHDRS